MAETEIIGWTIVAFAVLTAVAIMVYLFVKIKRGYGKIYRTCTFEGLGSKKDEFIGKVIQEMENRELRKIPPIKPLGLTYTLADAFKLWDWSMFDEMARELMQGADVHLGFDKEGVHKRMGLRSEVQGKNLRFGYFHTGKVDLKSAPGIKAILELVTFIAFLFGWGLFIGLVILGKPFYEAYGLVVSIIMLIIFYSIPLITIIYFVHRREIRPIKEIDRSISEIAESMGGKRITAFKMITVKLEE